MKITNEDKIEAIRVIEGFKRWKSDEEIFYELCFCICAPQTTFTNNTRLNNILIEKNLFKRNYTFGQLKEDFKLVRFYYKAKFVLEAKKNFAEIICMIRSDIPWKSKREWLVKNVRGIGMKAASHFLRNLGATDLAIIDVHVLKYLHVTNWKANKTRYLAVEEHFNKIAEQQGITPAELDAIVWAKFSNTPWAEFVH
jgi:N-glycosylase/DNA lyase